MYNEQSADKKNNRLFLCFRPRNTIVTMTEHYE